MTSKPAAGAPHANAQTNEAESATQAARPVLLLSHVTLEYEHDIRALDDVSLSVAAGERICVLGANGSGKSTLASVLCGLLAPDAGEVTLVGQKVYADGGPDFEAYRRARRELGLVFQNPDDQIVTSVVEDDVAFGPENLGVPSDQIGLRVARELHRVALDDYAKADPTRLSGGQKQRVTVAGALAMEPQVLVLDEPGALLDVRGRRSIMHVMDKLQQAGTTVVHITHFMEEAFQADRVLVMSQGRIVLEGTPQQVFAHGDELRDLGLEKPFGTRLAEKLRARGMDVPWAGRKEVMLAAIAGKLPRGDAAQSTSTLPANGEKPASAMPDSRTPTASATPAICVDHVSFSYGRPRRGVPSRRALDDVSFSIAPGTAAAIVGQTGSGKSTLLRLICALEVPDSGKVLIGGTDTGSKKGRRRIHGTIGYVMQHPERQLFAETVAQDVAYGPTNMKLPAEEVARRVDHALDLVGLSHKRDASPFELSGGQKRLCAIAGVLAMEPATLVLDEPTAGLDPQGRLDLRRILERIHARGVTVVQVTHSMEDAAHAQQVIVLDQSRLLMQGTPAQVFSRGNEAQLNACGLGLPRPLRWAHELEALGAPDMGEPLTSTELANAIVAATERDAAGNPAAPKEATR